MGLWRGYSPVTTSKIKASPRPVQLHKPAASMQLTNREGVTITFSSVLLKHILWFVELVTTLPTFVIGTTAFAWTLTSGGFVFAAEPLYCWGTGAKPVCWVTTFTSKTICLLVLTQGAQTQRVSRRARLASHKFWGRRSLWHGQKNLPSERSRWYRVTL